MVKMFDNIEIGDQLELTVGSGAIIYGNDIDPNMVAKVAIVTHIWFDPVDNKEYVALSYVKNDGTYGRPTEKRTLTGLARTGWRKARIDYLQYIESLKSADKNVVLPFYRRK